MPLIEGFGDEVVCLLGFLLSLVLVIFAWLSTRVVDGGTLVSVVLLDRERFTGLLQRVRDRVGVRSLSTSINSTASIPNLANSNSNLANSQVAAQSDQQSTEQFLVSAALDSTHPVEDDGMVIRNGRSETDVDVVQPSQSFTLIEPITTSSSISTNSGLLRSTGVELLESNDDVDLSTEERVIRDDQANDTRDNTTETVVLPTVQSPETSALVETSKNAPTTSENALTASENAPTTSENVPASNASNFTPVEGHIRIRLQYVDGRQRMVYSHPDNTVGVFKRTEFSEQLTDGRSVRFVVNGQELRDDAMTLRACSVGDGSVIHCLVSQPSALLQSTPTSDTQRAESRQWDLGVLMFPLFGCVLGALWYARVMYRVFFNAASTFSLIAISFLYIVGLLASWRNSNLPGHVHVE